MRSRLHTTTRILAVLSLVFGLAACGSAPRDLVREGTATIEADSTGDVHFTRVGVYKSDTGLLISGDLHKRDFSWGAIRGHIDIEVIASDGTTLATTSIKYHRGRSESRTARFSVELPIEVPMNSTVRITHHDEVAP